MSSPLLWAKPTKCTWYFELGLAALHIDLPAFICSAWAITPCQYPYSPATIVARSRCLLFYVCLVALYQVKQKNLLCFMCCCSVNAFLSEPTENPAYGTLIDGSGRNMWVYFQLFTKDISFPQKFKSRKELLKLQTFDLNIFSCKITPLCTVGNDFCFWKNRIFCALFNIEWCWAVLLCQRTQMLPFQRSSECELNGTREYRIHIMLNRAFTANLEPWRRGINLLGPCCLEQNSAAFRHQQMKQATLVWLVVGRLYCL